MRMLGIRPSKADIVRAALVLASGHQRRSWARKLRSQMAADAAGAPAGTTRATAGASR
jgi:Arc/MetJ-type ribon-helix-helix transcriptional regulator